MVGQHPLVIRLLKGVFNLTPPMPKYSKMWKVSTVLDYLSSLAENRDLTLLSLSHKLLTLMALVSAQRSQTLACLDLRYFHFLENSCVITVMDILKTTCPKKGMGHNKLVIPNFEENPQLCVLTALKDYLHRTEDLRAQSGETKLFLSTRKPHKAVTSSTLARWMKCVLREAGIDATIYSAHSFRSASTSTAFAHGVTLQEILKTADWTNVHTFSHFYLKAVEEPSFGNTILSCNK